MGRAANPIPKRLEWRDRPTCGECGLKVRRPRPNDVKRCPMCKKLQSISNFPHARGRADHRESYDRDCKRQIQNAGRRRVRKSLPISNVSPVGKVSTVLLGTFVSQGPFTEYRETPASIGPQLVKFETHDKRPVYQLMLKPPQRPHGTPEDDLRLVHTFTDLARAPLEVGQWLACVIQQGQLEKVLRQGDEQPIVDTSIEITEDEDSALGLRFGSFALARPWILPLALEFTLGAQGKEPKEEGCPLCGHPSGEVQDFTLHCDDCTDGLRWSAAEILVAHAEVDPAWVFEFISKLEDIWLLGLIPEHVEVSA